MCSLYNTLNAIPFSLFMKIENLEVASSGPNMTPE
jgi:hypothetical protein